MEPPTIAERLWPGRVVSIEPLAGGITNRNFKVVLADEPPVVLRLGGRDTELLGIDRGVEAEATRAAAAVGVGPEVVTFEADGPVLVTRFIEGRPIPPEHMRTAEQIARVADALRRLHGAPPISGGFDAHRVCEAYAATARERGVRVPADYRWAHGVSERIERARGEQRPVPCHNDLLNSNFLDDGELRIVDWEYAGMGDRFFDLANFSVNHELSEDDDEMLLRDYFGELRAADFASLRLMRFMSDFREAMWGVVQQGISTLDFDYRVYAREHLDRMHLAAGDNRFDRWLATARS